MYLCCKIKICIYMQEKTKTKKVPEDWTVIPKGDRFIIVEKGTNNLIDDAQGYGYKTKDGAYKAAYYKLNQKSIIHKQRVVNNFLENHPEFNWRLCDLMMDAAKFNGSVQPEMVDSLASELNQVMPYSAEEFLRILNSKNNKKK